MNPVEAALARRLTALNEYDAKRFLADFGIPICRERLVSDPDTAADEAANVGFPVVLKAAGSTLFHKTNVGGVVLNLRTPHEVREESRRLLQIPGSEGVLVQEMVQGTRELVCGLTRDAQLGPCVLFGLGGVLTEALEDAVFRLAPLTSTEAQKMVHEIRSVKLLGAVRGEAAVDAAALASILVALGEIGLRYEAVQAIDLNPVKIRPDGGPVAVDALITLRAQDFAPR
jgi:acetyl-CoA synthetase (ADP-forming)